MVKDRLSQIISLFWKDKIKWYSRAQLKPLLSSPLQLVKKVAKENTPYTLRNVAIVPDQLYIDKQVIFINFDKDNINNL